MKFKTHSQKQRAEIVKNKNVAKFFNTYIEYTPEFKVQAVDHYLKKGKSPKEIFKDAGFDLAVFDQAKRKYLLRGWLRVFKNKGMDGLKNNGRGKIKTKRSMRPELKLDEKMADVEKIKRLKLEVKYLKKENDFLVKLRATRAE